MKKIVVTAVAVLVLAGCSNTNLPGGHDYENGLADAPVKGAYLDVSHPDVIWSNPDGYPNILCRKLNDGVYVYMTSGNRYGATDPFYSDKPCIPENVPSWWRVADPDKPSAQ